MPKSLLLLGVRQEAALAPGEEQRGQRASPHFPLGSKCLGSQPVKLRKENEETQAELLHLVQHCPEVLRLGVTGAAEGSP